MNSWAPLEAARRAAFESAVSDLYAPIQRYLRRRCAPDDADEILNDVLLTLWRRLDEIPVERRVPWTYGVARRCLANHRRGVGRRLRLTDKAGALLADAQQEWITEADVRLHDAMGRLSEDDREIVRLWAWERLEPREIAEVLGSNANPNAVSARLGRIRQRLENDISRHDRANAGHEHGDGHVEEER